MRESLGDAPSHRWRVPLRNGQPGRPGPSGDVRRPPDPTRPPRIDDRNHHCGGSCTCPNTASAKATAQRPDGSHMGRRILIAMFTLSCIALSQAVAQARPCIEWRPQQQFIAPNVARTSTTIDLSSGAYRITIETWDGYPERVASGIQSGESVTLTLSTTDGPLVVGTTPDLADLVVEASATTAFDAVTSAPITGVELRHADSGAGPDSVWAIVITFCPVPSTTTTTPPPAQEPTTIETAVYNAPVTAPTTSAPAEVSTTTTGGTTTSTTVAPTTTTNAPTTSAPERPLREQPTDPPRTTVAETPPTSTETSTAEPAPTGNPELSTTAVPQRQLLAFTGVTSVASLGALLVLSGLAALRLDRHLRNEASRP